MDIVGNSVSVVPIIGTRRKVRLRWMKPYTIERITDVWLERDLAAAEIEKGSDVAKDLCKEPYFAFKEAALMILNHDLKIRLFYGLYWRWLARRYSEAQMLPIIAEGKKKFMLEAHYNIMAYSLDMRTDLVRMTKKEAEQYQAELILAQKRLSARTSPNTDSPGSGYSDGRGTSATDAS